MQRMPIMINRTVCSMLAAALIAGGGSAIAAPIASLVFSNPNGIVNNTEMIQIFVNLTLDPLSVPLITDGSGNVTSGLTVSDVQAHLFGGLPSAVDPLRDVLSSNVNVFLSCAGTFFTGCGGNPYDFIFSYTGAFIGTPNLNLLPGSTTNYAFGTLTPTGGAAPAGTYSLDNVGFFIQVFDETVRDINGDRIHIADVPIADVFASSSTRFTRTVVNLNPTPEPATYALVFAGLFGVIGLRRKSRLTKDEHGNV